MNITTQNMRALFINVLLALAMVAAVFAVVGGGWSFAKYTGFLPFRKAKRVLTIDETPITIENVKAIGELVTATYYDETVVIIKHFQEVIKQGSSKGKDTTVFYVRRIPESKATGKDELVIIQKAHARIGVDLAELTDSTIRIDEAAKSVKVTLPEIKCLDFIMNPTDTEVFSENGNWDLDDLKEAMAPAKEEIEAKMNANETLFANACKSAQEVITRLFQSAGYESVEVYFVPKKTWTLQLPSIE